MKMENKLFTIGTKSVKIPLVQGGMGIGISLSRLAGTVAKQKFYRNVAGGHYFLLCGRKSQARQLADIKISGV